MKSMTGYGRGEAAANGCKATVELSAVNRKQAEYAINLPNGLDALESRVRDELAARISRGRVNAKIVCQEGVGGTGGVRVNRELARAYALELGALARELGLEGGVTLEQLLRVPGVLQPPEGAEEIERWFPLVQEALGDALAALVGMREAEGRHLEEDLKGRVETMRAAAARVRAQAPKVLERYREQLRERIRSAGLELPAHDDDRLLKEVVIFADRSDLSEELARLDSHFAQFETIAKLGEPVGRALDFLAQEMNREINTIGSKANDAAIAREVVVLKTELEKFREQVQNVE